MLRKNIRQFLFAGLLIVGFCCAGNSVCAEASVEEILASFDGVNIYS